MTTLIRLIAIVMALALLVALAPRLRTEFHLRALRVQALMGPRPAYLTHRFVDNLIAAHRATFGTAVMAALELWDAVLPSDLTQFSREVPIPQEYGALARLLPDTSVNSFKARIRTLTRTLRAAKFRAYNAENYIAGRPFALTITDIILPPLGQKIPLTELELLEQAFASGTLNDDVIQQIYDDAETNVRATRARMQLAKGDVITDGKFSLVGENGLTLDADFTLASSHKPTAGTLWSDHANSTPIDDERAWIAQMVADGGGRPTIAVTSLTVLGHLQSNAQYIRALWGPNATNQPNLNIDQVNQVRAAWQLPPIVLDDTVIDVDGTTTRVLPVNKYILANENGLGETQYGVTAQALEAASGGTDAAFTRRDAPGIFSATYKQTEPPGRWTSTAANGMPILFDVTKLVSATVA
jgi:hypothetical protein